MRLALRFLWVGLILNMAACTPTHNSGQNETHDLVIFAAASLTDTFTDLAEAFEEQNPSANLVLNFASSSQLAAQLREGVTADIFASANDVQMLAAIESQRIDPVDVELFAANRLTIVVPAGNPAGIHAIQDLGKPGVTLLLAVKGVPVRDYADQIIENFPRDIQVEIYQNLISEESNVRQISTKVALGEADAGIVYASDFTPDIADRVEQIEIPDALNVMTAYPIAVIVDSQQKELANGFVSFVISTNGQAILAQWGFTPIHIEESY